MQKIEVTEYECAKCHYKWINRYNGKNNPTPKRCAKCKNKFWNEGLMSGAEKEVRNRVRYYIGGIDKSMEFLNVVPRPTIEELQSVIKYYNTLIYQSEQQSDDELNQEYYAELHNKCDEFMQQIIDSRSQVSNTLLFNRDAITDSPNTLEDKIRND